MKKFLFFSFLFLTVLQIWAQSPAKMSYQAVLRDDSGNLLTSQNVGMQISILQGDPTGTAVYVESHAISTNENGLISIEIGGGTFVSGSAGSIGGIDWENGPYYLFTELDPAGGTQYTISGTSQMIST
ncbi:MAG: hypothetical protein AAF696_37215, partial [Bacteroidota bacterium]